MNYKNYNDYEIMYMISENDDDALNILYHKYEPIVKSYAKKYSYVAKKYGLETDDLIQEGLYAIHKALSTYKDTHNTLFYTYVDFCIRGRMNNLLRLSNSKGAFSLNSSLSLNEIAADGCEYLQLVSDKNSINPQNEMVLFEKIQLIKTYLYGLDIEDACILELKMNGFKTGEIAKLLEFERVYLSKRIYRLKDKFRKCFL